MNRATGSALIALAFVLGACSKTAPEKAYVVEEVPLSQVASDLGSGKTTSAAVAQAYIDRIKTYDGQLHAVIVIAPDALEQAKASDARRKAGKSLGPLDGVPILLKDNIDVVGVPTTAGSYALIDNLPVKDAELTRRLREAGIIILGKTNTSQFAGLRTSDIFEGSTVGGVPHNPYNLTHSACGSSNGSGIAVAVSFAAAAVGTDTTGSVICPATYMSLVGLRPTIALISRHGVVPISMTQDTAGPMARNVTDAALLLNVLAGTDPADPATKEADAHRVDYAKGLAPDALKGVRLGVIRGFGGYSDATKPIFEDALKVLTAQGAELVEVPPEAFEDLSQEQRDIMLYEFKDDLAAYLRDAPPAVKVRTLADVMEFSKTESHEKLHGQDLFEESEATVGGRRSPEYQKALEYGQRRAREDGFDKAMSQLDVKAFVVLSRGPAPEILPDGTPTDYVASKRKKGAVPPSASGTAALAGYPDLTVPMGEVDGLPVGLSFIGPAWSDGLLLSLGYAYEQASHGRTPPTAYKAAAAAK